MSRILLLLFVNLGYILSYATNTDTLKVYQNNDVHAFILSEIDSITHSEDAFVNIHQNEHISKYPIANVDSMIIISNPCYKIPEEQLNGWEDGVYCRELKNDNSFYIVRKSNSEDGSSIVYMNDFGNDDITQSLILSFNAKNDIKNIFMYGYQFEAYPTDEYITFLAYGPNGNAIDSFNVPYEENVGSQGVLYSRAIEHYRIVNIRKFLGLSGKIIWNTAGISINLEDGKYADILKDFLTAKLAGLMTKSFFGQLTVAQMIDMYVKQLYENNKNWFLGNAEIEISSIKRNDKSTISIEGEILNISTIPSRRFVVSEYPNYIDGKLVYLKEIPNYVLWGVAESESGQPGLHLHSNCTTPVVVSENKFTCILPINYQSGKTFYFRPFLVPSVHLEEMEDWGQAIGNMISTNIRYGERKEYTDQIPTCLTGDVINVTDKSAEIKCLYKGATGFECGVVISSEEDTKKFTTGNDDGEYQIHISELRPSTTYNYWAYIDVDGIPVNGEMKTFTTNPPEIPDISGTWTCTEYTKDGSVYETFNVTLYEDGSAEATEDNPGLFHGTCYGTWSVDYYGNVGVSLIYYSTDTSWAGKSLFGKLQDINNPTSINGTAYWYRGHIMGGSASYTNDLIMTR